MGGADEHRLGADAAALLDFRARPGRQVAGDKQQVHPHQRHALPAVVEHRGADFAGVVKAAVVVFAVIAGRFHADLRRDVPLGEPGAEVRRGGGLRRGGRPRGRGRGDEQSGGGEQSSRPGPARSESHGAAKGCLHGGKITDRRGRHNLPVQKSGIGGDHGGGEPEGRR